LEFPYRILDFKFWIVKVDSSPGKNSKFGIFSGLRANELKRENKSNASPLETLARTAPVPSSACVMLSNHPKSKIQNPKLIDLF